MNDMAVPQQHAKGTNMNSADSDTLARALVLIDDVWKIQSQGAYFMREAGVHGGLPDLSEAAAIARSQQAAALLAKLDALEVACLPLEIATTVEVARRKTQEWLREADWYWIVFDPMGLGFYAMFAPTAYGGGFLFSNLNAALAEFRFDVPGDADRYLGLLSDYGRVVRQLHARTSGQAQRGIRLPKIQLDQGIELLTRLKSSIAAVLVPADARTQQLGNHSLQTEISTRIAAEVEPAFDAFIAELSDPGYRRAAPDQVGIGQYPRGAEIYAELVRHHTTQDFSPEQVHQAGLDRMTAVRADMQALLERVGFAGTPAEYVATIERDPRWRATGSEEVAAVFNRYIERMAPRIDEYFAFKPAAGHAVAPLPDALSKSMTFGYYDPPSRTTAVGRYLFNAQNLSRNALVNIAALNYHELVPGHHMHVASQRENDTLVPLRKHNLVNAFNEGWAEYAATLAGEMGMYQEPEEQFGRYMMDAFLTCRLVVDTGMNVLGWTLQQARDYMRAHSFMPEIEINSESIRYSCDIPGQSLAYKLGDTYLLGLRERMRAALAHRFDVRDFHDAVLKPGSLPLPLVAANVEATIERLASGR
jgi:uncharacterized protein (DUF885 family)